MAAIDPSAEAEDLAEGAKPRATLKLIRQPLNLEYDDEDEDESDFDEDEMNMLLAEGSESEEDAEEDEEETKTNGGSSEPKSKKARKAAAAAEIKKLLESEEMEVDSKDTKTKDKKSKVNGKANGKGKDLASDVDEEVDEDEEDEEDSDVDSFDSGDEVEEFVICTLDPEKVSKVAGHVLLINIADNRDRLTNKPWTSLLARMRSFTSRYPVLIQYTLLETTLSLLMIMIMRKTTIQKMTRMSMISLLMRMNSKCSRVCLRMTSMTWRILVSLKLTPKRKKWRLLPWFLQRNKRQRRLARERTRDLPRIAMLKRQLSMR